MKMGLRLRQLGTEALTWGDLYDYVRYGNTDTALALERYGDAVLWGVTDHLLGTVVDALLAGNWQRGGGKGRKPDPIKRPGAKESGQTLGSEPIAISEFDAWWDGD